MEVNQKLSMPEISVIFPHCTGKLCASASSTEGQSWTRKPACKLMFRTDTVHLSFRFQMSLANLGVCLKLMFFASSDSQIPNTVSLLPQWTMNNGQNYKNKTQLVQNQNFPLTTTETAFFSLYMQSLVHGFFQFPLKIDNLVIFGNIKKNLVNQLYS